MARFDQVAHAMLPLLRKLGLEKAAYDFYESLGRTSARFRGRQNRAEIERVFARAKDRRVIVGPFHSEIGFEILYWVPFLRWAFKKYGIDPKNVTVISRGGSKDWYRDLAKDYVDIFKYVTPDELRSYNEKRVEKRRTHKQNLVEAFEQELLNKVVAEKGYEDYVVIHPLLMYRQLTPFWSYVQPISEIDAYTNYQCQAPLPKDKLLQSLPEEYVAVKFYFSACFPPTDSNKAFVRDFITRLAKKTPVVLLSTGLSIDDHSETGADGLQVISIEDKIKPINNIDVQTRVLSHAKAFVGTYGGFSYIAPFYGVPSLAFYSNEEKFLPTHLEVAMRAYRKIKYGSFYKFQRGFDKPESGPVELMAINVNNVDLLRRVI